MTADGYAKVLDAPVDWLQHLREDGRLDRVSHRTFPGARAERDRGIPCGAMAPSGQGPLLTTARSYVELVERKGGGSGQQ